MKFGQLIEYNMRKCCFEKSYTKCMENLVPDPFLEIKMEHIFGLIV